jgi:hypothetical protein
LTTLRHTRITPRRTCERNLLLATKPRDARRMRVLGLLVACVLVGCGGQDTATPSDGGAVPSDGFVWPDFPTDGGVPYGCFGPDTVDGAMPDLVAVPPCPGTAYAVTCWSGVYPGNCGRPVAISCPADPTRSWLHFCCQADSGPTVDPPYCSQPLESEYPSEGDQ